MVEEENPMQMVYFMLEDNGKPVFGGDLLGLSGQILKGNRDLFETLNIGGEIHDAQAALFVNLMAFMADNPGIDQDQNLLFFILSAHINNNQLNGFTNLRRGKPYAGRVVHGLHHVFDQVFEVWGKISDRFGLPAKEGVGKF